MSTLSTLEKCVQILNLFTEAAPRLSVDDISARLGIPKSTVYRYLTALKKHRLIAEDSHPGIYRLGEGLLVLARGVVKRLKPTTGWELSCLTCLSSAGLLTTLKCCRERTSEAGKSGLISSEN